MKTYSCLIQTVCVCCVLLLSLSAAAQSSSDTLPKPLAASVSATTLPYRPSLDVSSMDKSVDPCVDFFRYSCGGWKRADPIPPDRTSWGVYAKLYEDNLGLLRAILEQAAVAKDRDAVTQKVGDFYGSCLNEAAVNRRGLAAIKPQLDSIAALKTTRDLAPVVGR